MEAAKEEKKEEEGKDAEKKEGEGPSLSAEEGKALTLWMIESLGSRVSDVEATSRLVDSPAIVSEHDNAVTRRMMAMEEFKSLGVNKVANYKLQVNLAQVAPRGQGPEYLAHKKPPPPLGPP